MPLIEFRNAQLGYSRRKVILGDVTLTISRGEFLGIVGPNGSGKTTLLRTLLGLIRPIGGEVNRGEHGALRIGYVPQRETVDTLFPIPVQDIVLMGRYGRIGVIRRPGQADREVARRCLEHVGIAHLADRNYPELSGGQRQRVLIARALATEPELLVLDEPTHGMDMPSEHALMDLVSHLHSEHGLAVVIVSHLLGAIAEYAQRIAIITEGHLEAGDREEMLTAERLSRLFGMDVRVYQHDGKYAVLPAGGGTVECLEHARR